MVPWHAPFISGSKALLQGCRGQFSNAAKGGFFAVMPDSLHSQDETSSQNRRARGLVVRLRPAVLAVAGAGMPRQEIGSHHSPGRMLAYHCQTMILLSTLSCPDTARMIAPTIAMQSPSPR